MKIKIQFALITTLTFVAILLVVFFYLISGSGYQLINTEASSDSRYFITEFRSNSEAGHAPYGTHIVLSKKPITNLNEGHIIYAGYCFNINYTWHSTNKINLNCTSNMPIKDFTLAKSSYGIMIKYNKTHNNTSKLD